MSRMSRPTIISPRKGRNDPAVLRCGCGAHVHLSDPLDNTCDQCGQTYNMGGQQVVHSSRCDAQGNPFEDYEP